jgi:hypothetical protein
VDPDGHQIREFLDRLLAVFASDAAPRGSGLFQEITGSPQNFAAFVGGHVGPSTVNEGCARHLDRQVDILARSIRPSGDELIISSAP